MEPATAHIPEQRQADIDKSKRLEQPLELEKCPVAHRDDGHDTLTINAEGAASTITRGSLTNFSPESY